MKRYFIKKIRKKWQNTKILKIKLYNKVIQIIEQYNQGRQNHNINLIVKFLGNHIKSTYVRNWRIKMF